MSTCVLPKIESRVAASEAPFSTAICRPEQWQIRVMGVAYHMQITFLDINSSYSHSSLALPLLHGACAGIDATWSRVAGTTSDKIERLATAVAEEEPQLVLATMYLFTHEFVLKVLRRVHALIPDAAIVLGGPEFLGENDEFLRRESYVTAVVRGDGELALPALLAALDEPSAWGKIDGLCWLDDQGGHDNGMAVVDATKWNALPAPAASEFFTWERPFIQLETSRGCPHACSFCTSSQTGQVRWRDLDDVRAQLNEARERGIHQIRVLDRTFNATPAKAIERLDLFRDEFPELRFHLEIHPGLLSGELREALATYPKGGLHLEVGLQTTHPEAMELCRRTGAPDAVLEAVGFLCGCDDFDVHVDLLSGLPSLPLEHLLDDLNRIALLQPAEIQLETLKVLPGTPLAADAAKLGLQYAPDPPYEVLATPLMTAHDMMVATDLSRVVDHYYNVGEFRPIVIAGVDHDSGFFIDLLSFLSSETDLTQKPGLVRRGRLVHRFLSEWAPPLAERLIFRWLESGMVPSKCPGDVRRGNNLPEDAKCLHGQVPDDLRNVQIWHLRQSEQDAWFLFDRSRGSQPVAILTDSSVSSV